METVKFLKIAVVLLLLLNFGTLFFLLSRRPGPPPAGPGRAGGPGDFIVRTVGFDEGQRAAFDSLRHAHRDAMLELRRHNGQLRQQLYGGLAAGSGASGEVLLDSIAAGQKTMERLTFDHFSAVRALCRPDQQPKFDAILDDVVREVMTPGAGRGPR